MKTIKDFGKGLMEAFKNAEPKPQEYLDVLAIMFLLMKELRTKPRNEVEALMDEEIQTIRQAEIVPFTVTVAEGLPALGIVAAVLGVVKAMGAIDQPPES